MVHGILMEKELNTKVLKIRWWVYSLEIVMFLGWQMILQTLVKILSQYFTRFMKELMIQKVIIIWIRLKGKLISLSFSFTVLQIMLVNLFHCLMEPDWVIILGSFYHKQVKFLLHLKEVKKKLLGLIFSMLLILFLMSKFINLIQLILHKSNKELIKQVLKQQLTSFCRLLKLKKKNFQIKTSLGLLFQVCHKDAC